ncbi:2-C-methyl-D-erythritol 4-phosphate cytidylyltransferase [Carboxydochorda subterranea]|uniref:2-C-methyl-D-erythritol 4-phosphate cytidylyltransferase n=1 Tax=Carboxydichorda subterranea TaxID=3109565 RepID=A0ABZ1BYB5_9FIRM|nr:2-C-methyl-D-erythritol 4-phosphate cytidylyltransferase [Limnochorda sp. L945t]WRP17691.1 2-C-methyl-D-erythritol 4-phosphate cytidylyltransferase [Limnochorda sp. L945t]
MTGTVAVVVAAGQGRRMQDRWQGSVTMGFVSMPVAKQFLPVQGKPLVWWALDVMERADVIDSVVLVVPEGNVEWVRGEIVERLHLSKVHSVVAGGVTRQESVFRALQHLQASSASCDYVVVHDGVRPLVSEAEVASVLEEARRYGAATLGVPARETIKVVDPKGLVVLTPQRDRLWSIQTPQAFRFRLLVEAHAMARARGYAGSDDCSLVEALGEPVRVVAGSQANIKVTCPEDLVMVEALLARRRELEEPGGGGRNGNR